MTVKVNGKEYETEMVNGVQRFKANSCVRYLFGRDMLDMNEISIAYQQGDFSQQEYAELVIMSGYSVSNFADNPDFEDMEIENPLWENEG